MTDRVIGDSEIATIWGDVAPGTVFWEEVESPANSILLDGDKKARKLNAKKLASLKKEIQRVSSALAVWDYSNYPAKLAFLERKIEETEDTNERKQWTARHKRLKANPPDKPKKPFLSFLRRDKKLVIHSEKQAQAFRLWLDRVSKRILEHETAVKNAVIYEQLAKEMQLEVGYFAQRLIARWTWLQYREEFYKKGKRKFKKIQIERAVYTEDEIQYKIKVAVRTALGASRHILPDNVKAWDLVKPETLVELTAACERPVGSPHTENNPESFQNGVWITVYREGLTDGLFDYVDYSKVIAKYDESKYYRFPVPIGVMRGRLVQWLYLDNHPHMMCNGITGSGKTNVIRVALVTWCERHSPREIRFYLVDLKRGGDFRKFANIPHLARPVMQTIEDLDEVVPALVTLMYQRMDKFNETAVRDIDDYNKNQEERMERIVVVIDECSAIDSLANDKAQRERIWRGLGLISTQARAAGIHLLLGTQQSFSDAIPKTVRDNITFVLSGRQRTLAASMATFGTGKAKKLPNIKGRMFCDDGGDLFQVQTPYCSENDVDKAVAIAMEYGMFKAIALPTIEDVTKVYQEKAFDIDDVIRIAIEQFDGVLAQHKIHALDEVPISRDKVASLIREITSHETIHYDDELYKVSKYGSGYQLVRVTKDTDYEADTISISNSNSDSIQDSYYQLAGD